MKRKVEEPPIDDEPTIDAKPTIDNSNSKKRNAFKPMFDILSYKYTPSFVSFLHQLIHASIVAAENPKNNGCYISSWVLNKTVPNEMMQFEWNGTALVQDAVHDASRAENVEQWTTSAVNKLIEFFGKSEDINFEVIKQNFLQKQTSTADFDVNLMIIPSTIDQSATISNYIPSNCIHTFDNGAKKADAFGVEYVTQATIYDTGKPVFIQDNVRQFPVIDDDFVNFGTLTITVMPDVNKSKLQVFVIFSHGRIIYQLPQKQIGMEGFMTFFDANDFKKGFLINNVVKFFNEKTLNANIKPVSNGEYLNENSLKRANGDGNEHEIMPEYFAEIIKFMGDKNQCIMSGYFSNLPNDTMIQRFFGDVKVNGSIQVNQLMLVSGDRYSFEEIYRFRTMKEITIPFTYFGSARLEKYYVKNTQDKQGFTLASSSSRCLFSVIRKTVNYTDDVKRVMSQMRETTNIIAKCDSLAKEYNIEMQLREEALTKLYNQAEREADISLTHEEKANIGLERITNGAELMDSIKKRIENGAIENLSKAYEHWVAHEQYSNEAGVIEDRYNFLQNEYAKVMPEIIIAKAQLAELESELSKLLNTTKRKLTDDGLEVKKTENVTTIDPERDISYFGIHQNQSDILLEVLDVNGDYIPFVDNNGEPITVNFAEYVEIDERYEKEIRYNPSNIKTFENTTHLSSLPALYKDIYDLEQQLKVKPNDFNIINPQIKAKTREIDDITQAVVDNKNLFSEIVDDVLAKRNPSNMDMVYGGMPKRKYLYARKFDTARFLNMMSMLRNKLNARRKRRSNKKHHQPAKTKRLSSRKLVRKAARRTKRKI
jgi:archaellum component FlaC